METAGHPDSTIDIDNRVQQGLKVAMSKVPWHIREADKDYYTPKLASIGPFHRNEPRLQSTEHKQRFLTCLLRPSINQPTADSNQTIDTLCEGVKNLQMSARELYRDLDEDIPNEEFVKMLVLDGCFLIQLFRFFNQGETCDPIFRTRWMVTSLQQDLLLLENQIPYSVLQKLFDLTAPLHQKASLEILILNFFGLVDCLRQIGTGDADHLLGFVHSSYASSVALPESDLDPEQVNVQLVSAVEFQHIGINIKPKSKRGDLLNLEYENRTLRIPKLEIDDRFIIAVRNFIAYEQGSINVKPYFTCFAIFLDGLISSPEDVKLFCRRGIIVHTLGSEEEVANVVNSLTKKVVFDGRNYLKSITERLNAISSTPTNEFMIHLVREMYNPRVSMATVVSFAAIYLAIIQTVFSFLTYFKQK